ncbi:predicted protein [Uncinocarpus reesii 1704]|uniref:Uncharacterized protein n=1 Tax=Uncinocarpus reesii (strain UAMH 1704) TaxID=336963 RepID=C4JFW1_UNCRE|nr:uncharacterized protein UREG_01041 [Uncinocarpus reesii 1704]EEP76192.1 predicted protein [Uncinocarpus reesii 1704]
MISAFQPFASSSSFCHIVFLHEFHSTAANMFKRTPFATPEYAFSGLSYCPPYSRDRQVPVAEYPAVCHFLDRGGIPGCLSKLNTIFGECRRIQEKPTWVPKHSFTHHDTLKLRG